MAEVVVFLKAFLRHPFCVGSVIPSSPRLADVMTDFPEMKTAMNIVELGCGTGAITDTIFKRLPLGARYFGVELNEDCIKTLHHHYPTATFYHGSAEDLVQYMRKEEMRQIDVIISSLPWTTLPLDVKDNIFRAVCSCLSPKGVFVTFTYSHAQLLPSAWRFHKLLKERFTNVTKSRTVLLNVPPAFSYFCRF